jgi:hypothetical protein
LNNPGMQDQSGANNYRSKLTEEQVRTIHDSPEVAIVLARRFNVSVGHINNIKREITWRHLWSPDTSS